MDEVYDMNVHVMVTIDDTQNISEHTNDGTVKTFGDWEFEVVYNEIYGINMLRVKNKRLSGSFYIPEKSNGWILNGKKESVYNLTLEDNTGGEHE